MATISLTRGSTLPDSSAKADFHNLVDLASGSISAIVNADIDAAAAIANSKLNLASITQNVALSGTIGLNGVVTVGSKIVKLAKGADVASAAGTITLGDDGNYFDITGTDAITSITAKAAGTWVVLQFDSTASLVDGSNLKLNSTFQGAAEAQILLVSDGTNWFELSRSTGQVTFASNAEVKTGTEDAKAVAPSTMIGHEGIAKGWAVFAPIGGTGAITAAAKYNVSGINDDGTGIFTVSWATDFADANYVVMLTVENANDANPLVANVKAGTQAAGSVTILTTYSANPADPAKIHILAIGSR